MKLNPEQIKILIENYPHLGAYHTCKLLNLEPNKKNAAMLFSKARSLNIKVTKERASKRSFENKENTKKKFNEYSVDPTQFLNVQTPEVAYILGLLWADGNIYQTRTKKKGPLDRLSICLVEEDFIKIKWIFETTGKWNFYRATPDNRKPIITAVISNKPLCDFLASVGYYAKSVESACKILSKIPDHLKHYWWRGITDGDGCFCVMKNNVCQFNISGRCEQDWTFFFNLTSTLQVRPTFRKTDKEGGSYSAVVISTLYEICLYGLYIYQNYETDGMGLPRKYNKFLDILSANNNYKNKRLTNSSYINQLNKISYFIYNKKRWFVKHTNLEELFHEKKKLIIKLMGIKFCDVYCGLPNDSSHDLKD